MSTATLDNSWVLHVNRGNLGVVMPITDDTARRMPVGELTGYVTAAILRATIMEPGRTSDPVPADETPVALRLADRDTPLVPRLPLLAQTEGKWTDKDIPVEGQTEATARLPVCEFELIDMQRSVFLLPSR